ncbi:hypothetical protein SD71_13835 [Cohnella kolymensis]|uniref:DUF5050 domain-containing protein n=1 Tax=Cohnella kolymensis TaxID=1590652 RepID=A0ABR5A311_9BACL|nr:hypothetical protein [Cohnella kolymensis]KIL35390.1 hypothetical protein SD71_13835 [Cohnella kolymensis]
MERTAVVKKSDRMVFVRYVLVLLMVVFSFCIMIPTGFAAGNERQITFNETHLGTLALDGNKLVWTDRDYGDNDIFMYDLISNQKSTVSAQYGSNQSSPAIAGNHVVWMDDRNGDWDIYMEDLSTNQQTRLAYARYGSNPTDQSDPDIDGNRIVWLDERNYYTQIYVYDLSTNQETRITNDTSIKKTPVISGDKILWKEYAWQSQIKADNLYVYDLSTNQKKQITNYSSSTSSSISYHTISGDRVIWENYGSIYMYDLKTNQQTLISFPRNVHAYAIDGNKIVYTQNYWSQIYLYDLDTQQETQITNYTSVPEVRNLAISGNTIAWIDDRNGYWDVYVYDFMPTGTIQYNPWVTANQDIVATLKPSEPVTVTNNGGSMTYTFTQSGSFTFQFVDATGNTGSATAMVTIDKIAPTATIQYSNTGLTTKPVTATLIPSEPVTVTNNGGSFEYTFRKNSIFLFEFMDEAGNTGIALAKVNNIIYLYDDVYRFIKVFPIPIPIWEKDPVFYMETTYLDDLEMNEIRYATNTDPKELLETYAKNMETAEFNITEFTDSSLIGERKEGGELIKLTLSKSDDYKDYSQIVEVVYTKPLIKGESLEPGK